jgi:hypothetical protein
LIWQSPADPVETRPAEWNGAASQGSGAVWSRCFSASRCASSSFLSANLAPQYCAPGSDETLWGYFHDKETEFWNRRNRLVTPVLVFDQFEEIFTLGHGVGSAEAVLDELAALLENRPPESVRSALDGLRRRMPSIMENRMRLTRMDGRQARDAILVSSSHLVAPGVAEKVIGFVAASRGRTEGEAIGEAELSAALEFEPQRLFG